MILDIPELKEVSSRLERIEKLLSTKESWLSKDAFCQKFNVPDRTFQQWRKTGEIVTKKIGKHVFINLSESLR